MLNIRVDAITNSKHFVQGSEDMEEPVENAKENNEDIFDLKIFNVLQNFASEICHSFKKKFEFEYLLHQLSDPTRCIHAVPPNNIC